MSGLIHPLRYPIAFYAMLKRLETLSPGLTKPGFRRPPADALLREELAGMSKDELRSRFALLTHLQALITAWNVDGGNAMHTPHPPQNEPQTSEGISLGRLPDEVTFISYERPVELTSSRDASIEGLYVREVIHEGICAAEITVVCTEPGWHLMETCSYADAVRVGSHAAVGRIAIGSTVPLQQAASSFEGDPSLLADPTFYKAISAIEYATTSIAAEQKKPFRRIAASWD